MKAITLVLPMPLNVANSRGNTRYRNVEKKRYWAQCDYLQALSLVPPPPPQPFARASLRSVMRLGNPMDEDNAMTRHKWALDWLKTRGYIADDRKKCLRWEALPDQIVSRTEPAQLTLTLTPLTLP